MAGVVAGADDDGGMWDLGGLQAQLPAGLYALEGVSEPEGAALAWGLGAYKFDRYKGDAKDEDGARLVWPDGCRAERVLNWAASIYLVRDLINTPAGDMGPAEMAAAASDIAAQHGAEITVITGDALLRIIPRSTRSAGPATIRPA